MSEDGHGRTKHRNRRRAAQLFQRWERGSVGEILALIEEAEQEGEELANIVCGLLQVGAGMVTVAADGGEWEVYLEQVLGACLLAEVFEDRENEQG